MAPDESTREHGANGSWCDDDDDETGLVPADRAATLIIMHEGTDGEGARPPRLLMVRRAVSMRFAAGAAVFPGGRVDADDHALARAAAGTMSADIAPDDAAARVAAIRETLEETGLGVGIDPAGDQAVLAAMRAALLSEMPFSRVLADHGARLDLSALTPFSRWRPNFAHSRVFDTRFYITRMTGAVPALEVVSSENSELFWDDAANALVRADAGDLHIIFPTRRNLERLAQYANFAAALDSTVHFPSRRITPFIEERGGVRHLCIRGDCGYPVLSEPLGKAMRN